MSESDLRARVAGNRRWYHTMELAPGVVTPGAFDLRPVVERMPWPDVAGKRCLDVGTYDGFLAFELERRGAAEVVATDIADHTKWDWPPAEREAGIARMENVLSEKGYGFEIARDALGSKVEKVQLSIYDLDPATIGTFDVIVCGSLLLHLRDPLRALEAVRSVCSGRFLSAEAIDPWLTLIHRRRGVSAVGHALASRQWWQPNAAGHRRMVESVGFEIERLQRPYAIPLGAGHPRGSWTARSLRAMLTAGAVGAVTRGKGVAHQALLARPKPDLRR